MSYKIRIMTVNKQNEIEYQVSYEMKHKAIAENAAERYIRRNALYTEKVYTVENAERWYCKDVPYDENWVKSFG